MRKSPIALILILLATAGGAGYAQTTLPRQIVDSTWFRAALNENTQFGNPTYIGAYGQTNSLNGFGLFGSSGVSGGRAGGFLSNIPGTVGVNAHPNIGLFVIGANGKSGVNIGLEVGSNLSASSGLSGRAIQVDSGDVYLGRSAADGGLANNTYVNTLDLDGPLVAAGNPGTSGYVLSSSGSSTAPTWVDPGTLIGNTVWLLNGNAVATTKTLGTTTNFDVPLITNNIERVRITSGGNVGVNTNSPGQLLEVKNGNLLLSNSATPGQIQWQGTGAGKTIIQAGAQGATDISYVLPLTQGAVTSLLVNDGSGALSWQTASSLFASSFVQYNVTAPQSLATPRGDNLFNVTYSAAAANAAAAGAVISSTYGSGAGNFGATGLTVTATAGGTGTSTGLSVTAGGGTTNYAALLNGGNVGIGTSTPTQPLEVDGNILLGKTASSSSQLQFQNPAGTFSSTFQAGAQTADINYTLPLSLPTSNQAGVLRTTPAGVLSWESFPPNDDVITGKGTATQIAYFSGGVGASSHSLTSSISLFWDEGNNRLGVGTGSTVSYPLEVVSSSAGTLELTRLANSGGAASNNGAALLFAANRTGPTMTNVAGITGLITDISASYKGALVLSTANGAAPAERMRIDNAGNVGIGTTSPSALLSVGSSSQFQVSSAGAVAAATGIVSSGTITFSGLSAGGLVKAGTGTGTLSLATVGTDYETGLTFNNGLTRSTNTVTLGGSLIQHTTITNGGFDFMITGTGRVGIGTATPAQALEVGGSGNLRLSNTSNVAGQLQMQGTGAGFTTFVAGAQGATNIGYTLPTTQGASNTLLKNDGAGVLSWTDPGTLLGNTFVKYDVTTTQGVATTRGDNLFDVSYSNAGANAAAAGAKITSSAGVGAGAFAATGLTISSTSTGGGTATGLNVTVSGSGSTYAALFSGGRVGIGTTTPSQALEVGGSGNILLSNTNNTAGQLQFQGTGTGTTTFAAGAQGASNISYTLPTALPSANNFVLTSSTGGAMTWTNVNSLLSSGFWTTTGNSGTTAGTNFIGTTDNASFQIAVKNSTLLRNSMIFNVNGSIQRDNSGDARGSNAVDLQIDRVATTQAASGTNSVIGGGVNNSAIQTYATVAGGNTNLASGNASFIGGGVNNQASGPQSTVTGGDGNQASASYASVGGGQSNLANTAYTTIGGGNSNSATGNAATVGGGVGNKANGVNSAIPGGNGLTVDASSFGFSGSNSSADVTAIGTNIAYFGDVDVVIGNIDNNPRSLRFYTKNTSNNYGATAGHYISFTAPATMSSNTSYIWPTSQGGVGTLLTNDGSGNLSWTTNGSTITAGISSPAAYAGSQTDLSVVTSTATIYRISSTSSSPIVIRSISSAGVTNGREVTFVNTSSNGNVIQFANEDFAGTAAYRIRTNSSGATIQLAPDDAITLWYDSSSSRWRVMAKNF